MSGTTDSVVCLPVDGVGEVGAGDDLATVLADAAGLRDGDVLVVTSKVVSKSEGRVVASDRARAVDAETDRVVATRGPTSIVRTRHGLVMAAAGVDASNTAPGTVVLLPEDPDRSARAMRERIGARSGLNVAVLVTDTAGRAWRTGQTDIAIGVAGLDPLHDFAGHHDGYGNELAVTAPAVADELAAAADLVKGKLGRRPAAVVRGLGHLVLPAGAHGPGAAALVRAEREDMFGLGAREAVLRALLGDPRDLRGFGEPADAEALVGLLGTVAEGGVVDRDGAVVRVDLSRLDVWTAGRVGSRVTAAAFALGWLPVDEAAPAVRLRFATGTP
jgi:coenzyme F420-0:L-glutamate ligase/coenzyme F420-1:gamma-L-glutamate ligase